MKNILIGVGVFLVIALIIVVLIVILKKTEIIKNPKELILTYDISSGIPYKWEHEIEDESIVAYDRSYHDKNNYNKKGIAGGKVVTHYVFKGLKEGTTKITFKFVSLSREDEEPTRYEHIVTVDKDLNIKEVIDK